MKPISNGLSAIYALMVSLIALTGLVLTAAIAPGCTGPAAHQPCDFVAVAKEAKTYRYSPTCGFQVWAAGSSAYVSQPAADASGVVIDKRSCRVCEVKRYGYLGTRLLKVAPAD